MPGESRSSYKSVALPIAEAGVLQELERLLLEHGALKEGEAIPVVVQDTAAIRRYAIGCAIENETVVALSVRYCALTSLPQSLGQLARLQLLDVTGNQLTTLPDSLGDLLHLRKLYLDGNQLTELPETIGSLPALVELHVEANLLTTLPANISQLSRLE